MRPLKGEQFTLLAKMKKLLPHIPEGMIHEQIAGTAFEDIGLYHASDDLAEIQLAWHNAPEGTYERQMILTAWVGASNRAFQAFLLGNPRESRDPADFIREVKELLFSSPPNTEVRRVIVGYLVTLLKEEVACQTEK